MNPELLKWLFHQPIIVVAAFVLGAVSHAAHPEYCTPNMLASVLALIALGGGSALNFQAVGPLQTWTEVPPAKKEEPAP